MAAADNSELKTLVEVLVEDARDRKASKQVPLGKAKVKTPWNPSGELRKVKLKHKKFYQNGAEVNTDLMTDDEIALVNQLKPGRYNKRKWEVVKRKDKSLDVRYPNKTLQQRWQLKAEASNFSAIIQKILLEQEEQAARKKRGEADPDDDY
jgi:hypothetical protein